MTRTLGELATIIRGTTYSGRLVGAPGPALLGLGSIEPGGGFRYSNFSTYGGDCPEKLVANAGDIYVALKGATKDGSMIGSAARVPSEVGRGRLTQDTARLIFRQDDPAWVSFVYWSLRTPEYRGYCAARQIGTGAASLQREDLLSFPLPNLTPQRQALTTALDAIEDRLREGELLNGALDAHARTLFQSSFVDVEENLPAGWRHGTLSDVCVMNARSAGKNYPCTEIKYVEISGVGAGRIIELSQVPYQDAPSRAKRLVAHGDTVMSTVRPDRRNFFLAYEPEADMVVSTGFVTLTPAGVPWSWLYLAATQSENFDELGRLADGGVYPAVRPGVIGGLPLVRPPNSVLEHFAKQVEPMLSRYQAEISQSRALVVARNVLLSQLYGGEDIASTGLEAAS